MQDAIATQFDRLFDRDAMSLTMRLPEIGNAEGGTGYWYLRCLYILRFLL